MSRRFSMGFNNLLWEKEGPVLTVTINRPHRLNALNEETVHELIEAMGRANADPDVRVVVITGAGNAFCAGADLRDAPEMTPEVTYYLVVLYLDLIRAIRRVEKPVVARVNGVAIGGGCCVAMASDIRIASQDARFMLAFINIGISAADMGATYLLPRIVGLGRAAELLMTGETVAAAEAERIGLVNRVVPPEELDSVVRGVCARLASRPPMGLAFTKRALYGGLDKSWDAELDFETLAQVRCILSEDFEEGRRAFLEKREPRFVGR